jgi:hypothetical protein
MGDDEKGLGLQSEEKGRVVVGMMDEHKVDVPL